MRLFCAFALLIFLPANSDGAKKPLTADSNTIRWGANQDLSKVTKVGDKDYLTLNAKGIELYASVTRPVRRGKYDDTFILWIHLSISNRTHTTLHIDPSAARMEASSYKRTQFVHPDRDAYASEIREKGEQAARGIVAWGNKSVWKKETTSGEIETHDANGNYSYGSYSGTVPVEDVGEERRRAEGTPTLAQQTVKRQNEIASYVQSTGMCAADISHDESISGLLFFERPADKWWKQKDDELFVFEIPINGTVFQFPFRFHHGDLVAP